MAVLLDICYFLGLLLAMPVLVYKSWRTGKYRTDWPARLGRVPPDQLQWLEAAPRGGRILLHCVSVGELLSTRLLVEELCRQRPEQRIIITTTTDTGTARARAMYGSGALAPQVCTLRYPLDFSWAVRRFLSAVQPSIVVLVELETWPNFIRIARDRNIPVRIINGRLTQRSFRRYRLIRPLIARMFRAIDRFGVQTPAIAERFIALGAAAERVEVLPTMKFDTADMVDQVPGADAFSKAVGLDPQVRLLVGGSTGPGEQDALIAAYLGLRREFADLRLAIAPRKPETVPQVLLSLQHAGLEAVRRSTRPDGSMAPLLRSDQVLVLDTMGELKKLYSVALGVFSGRSLIPLGGSDMIEVAALAKPCCFGPHTYNFADVVELLLQEGGAVVVHDGGELQGQVKTWLEDGAAARAMGLRARQCIVARRGSSQRYAQELVRQGGAWEHGSSDRNTKASWR
jgi:3-deoxy-D-manno-octulosonic-acid transferase